MDFRAILYDGKGFGTLDLVTSRSDDIILAGWQTANCSQGVKTRRVLLRELGAPLRMFILYVTHIVHVNRKIAYATRERSARQTRTAWRSSLARVTKALVRISLTLFSCSIIYYFRILYCILILLRLVNTELVNRASLLAGLLAKSRTCLYFCECLYD